MSTARARRTSDYDICWPRTPLLMPRATLRRAVLVQARRPAAVRSTRRWRGACVTAGPYREQSAERVRSGMSRRTVSPCWLSISAWVRKSPQSGLVRGTTALQDGRALPPGAAVPGERQLAGPVAHCPRCAAGVPAKRPRGVGLAPAMPAETRLSIVAMTLCGVFKQVPESLRICVEHGSGSFAFWAGRMDNAWHKRRDMIGTSEDPPSHYSGRF